MPRKKIFNRERTEPFRPASTVLSPEQVREIRERYRAYICGGERATPGQLAKEYGVSDTNIKNIIQRKIWKDVT